MGLRHMAASLLIIRMPSWYPSWTRLLRDLPHKKNKNQYPSIFNVQSLVVLSQIRGPDWFTEIQRQMRWAADWRQDISVPLLPWREGWVWGGGVDRDSPLGALFTGWFLCRAALLTGCNIRKGSQRGTVSHSSSLSHISHILPPSRRSVLSTCVCETLINKKTCKPSLLLPTTVGFGY